MFTLTIIVYWTTIVAFWGVRIHWNMNIQQQEWINRHVAVYFKVFLKFTYIKIELTRSWQTVLKSELVFFLTWHIVLSAIKFQNFETLVICANLQFPTNKIIRSHARFLRGRGVVGSQPPWKMKNYLIYVVKLSQICLVPLSPYGLGISWFRW